ncbi:MAG: hypothetical protein GXO80_06115 [Chlorobi bacterium]|nr:hypothetical protein [Chlorobiota bacterium]
MDVIKYVIVVFLFFNSCNADKDSKTEKEYPDVDIFWMQFVKAMENNEVNFLVKNSLDTVSCFDCNIDLNNEVNYFDAKSIFQNHMNKIMHLKSLSKKEYLVSEVDSNLMKIVYNVKTPKAPEGGYSLIFSLIKKDGKYFFQGMMVQ